jgi:hypothetical protein
MTTTTHTPGPWTTFDGRDGHHYIQARNGIGQFAGARGAEGGPAQDAANARLIASAPDLLAALDAMLGQYIAFMSQGAGAIHHQGDREAYLAFHGEITAQAHAAIRKARGEG